MKKIIFVDNDHKEKAEQNLSRAYQSLKYIGKAEIKRDDITLISDYHKTGNSLDDKLMETDNVIITWSMFTENHFGSYSQLCDFMVLAGLSDLQGKVFIDTATYLKDTLERAIEYYDQSIYIIRCIENNYIIHYDEDISEYKRLRFDAKIDGFLFNEDIDLNELLN